MAHELEIINGQAQMAYVGQVPWHGLGKRVSPDLTPNEMLIEAGLDWLVEKRDIYLDDHETKLKQKALVRSSDKSILTIVGDGWNPVQNADAFEFFNDFVLSGNMEMHTAGSLKNGKMVWALAKTKDSFNVFHGDEVEGYLLFSNPHQFGKSIDVRFVATRVVCNNTLTYALDEKSKHQVRLTHGRKFDGDMVKEALGISKDKLEMLRQQALFLGSKKFNSESIRDFFDKVYPKGKAEKDISRNAQKALEVLDTQPGANFAKGSYWHAFNTVTYMTDHVVGRSNDSRIHSAWYGSGKLRKDFAFDLALKMAEVA